MLKLKSNGFERAFLLLFLRALRTALPRFDRRLRRFNAEAQGSAEIRRGFFFPAFLCALRVSALNDASAADQVKGSRQNHEKAESSAAIPSGAVI